MNDRPDPYQQERDKWRNVPRARPADIVRPVAGQESVWDYPRPPRVDQVVARVRVEFEGRTLADTTRALYWSVRVGARHAKDAAWSYPDPDPGFEAIREYLAFYPRRMDACWVGEHRVTPQPGFYYGGWVTPDLVGPFKGLPGSESW